MVDDVLQWITHEIHNTNLLIFLYVAITGEAYMSELWHMSGQVRRGETVVDTEIPSQSSSFYHVLGTH